MDILSRKQVVGETELKKWRAGSQLLAEKMKGEGMDEKFDIVVIGGGPAGLSAAISARKLE
jgi:NADPH-dependent 2,4-dienoyl-CoA reductase/sulfur reductase-like enzyme